MTVKANEDDQPRELNSTDPVPGREHFEIQTEPIKEELTDKPPECDRDIQTDFYIDRPVFF